MTAKEKAIELVEKFKPNAHFWVHDLAPKSQMDSEQMENAKACAEILADEMLSLGLSTGSDLSDSFYLFWQQVKTEIQKL